jgi:hypothetical protein
VGLLYFLHFVKSPPPSAALGLVTCSKSELFLKILIILTFGSITLTGDELDARPVPIQNNKHRKTKTNIHAVSGIPIPEWTTRLSIPGECK